MTDRLSNDSHEDPPLIRHMETHLGPIAAGKIYDGGLQVVRFEAVPFHGAITYATLGLSHHVLEQQSKSSIRLELLVSCYERYLPWDIGYLAAAVAADVLKAHKPLQRGQVLGPAGPIYPGASAHALYCSEPWAYPDEFAPFRGSDPETMFVFLLPVTHGEVRYIWQHGWSAFEDHLERTDPDVWDLERPSTVPDPEPTC